MVQHSFPNYYPYPLDLIIPGLKLVTPIYEKKGEQFIKILDKGKILHSEVIEILSGQNIKHIFVQSSDRLMFINKVSDHLLNSIKNTGMDPLQRIINSNIGFNYVHRMASDIGIDEAVLELCQANINAMQEIVEEFETINKMLQDMINNNLGFKFQHCLLTYFLSSYLINSLEWGHKDQENILSYASFFHDICLKHDDWAEIESDKEIDRDTSLSKEEKKEIRNHTANAASLLSQFPKIPIGAATVIKRHHGSKDGIGYTLNPNGLSHLDIIFISAEKWANVILKAKKASKKIVSDDVFLALGSLYKVNKFKKAINALANLKF